VKTTLALFAVFALLEAVFAQGQQGAQDSLLDRARKGDSSALSEMEQSGDAQDLRTLLHDPGYAGKMSARIYLAKMGDREALQYFACRVLNNMSVEDLDQIGGGFEIALYRKLLDSDQTFFSRNPNMGNASDALITPPSSRVLFLLPKLLPSAGIASPAPLDVQAGKDGAFKAKWREWIDSHNSELQQLSPTTEGIRLDQHACSEIYDPTAMKRRLQIISGQGAIDCNRESGGGGPSAMSRCIKSSFKNKRAFHVEQDLDGIDSGLAVGLAANAEGDTYMVGYDDAGVNTTGLGNHAEVFDNGHIVVVLCPRPTEFRPAENWTGLTCLTQRGNLLLSPK
jgi:hypothetical protein